MKTFEQVAEELGEKAGRRGDNDSPYRAGSDRHRAWLRGWSKGAMA